MTSHASFAATLVDEWARAGVTDAVVAPGSRSAPLALALARDHRLRVHVVLDERSAAFRALGFGLASGRPAVLLCTSGTAAANFHPAVVEASYARRAAARLHRGSSRRSCNDTGAGQTIDQTRLYGGAVRWFCDPGAPGDERGAGATWRALASRAVAETLGPPPGPVHLNLPFREPLLPTGAPLVDAPGRPGRRPWTASTPAARAPSATDIATLADLARAHPRGLLVAGWGAGVQPTTATRFAAATGWPVLADPISQLRTGALAISTYEALLRAPGFADPPTFPTWSSASGPPSPARSRPRGSTRPIRQVLIDADGAWLDPNHAAEERFAVDADALLGAVADELGPPAPGTGAWLGDVAALRATGARGDRRRARRAVDAWCRWRTVRGPDRS